MSALSGRLLVATPAIDAGPFRRSLVFVLSHDDDGALGVIVNRPLPSDVEDVLPQWTAWISAPMCIFDGGPVDMDSALGIALVPGGSMPEGFKRLTGHVGLIDLDGVPPGRGDVAGLRVFAGYAGWSAGQLEDEIADGSWLVVDAREDDVLSPMPEELWQRVMRRQSGDLRFWATFPHDPAAN